MKYYIIAGEASGDLHASNLMHEIKKKDINTVFRFMGGDLMLRQGGTMLKHYKDMAFMGYIEVIKNLGKILNNIKSCKNDILKFKPDIIILVDYPGFNLRIAEFANKRKIKVYYYISPKIWAWKKNRAKKIKKYVDKMFVIFPFEKKFYKEFNYDVVSVGNPLLDAVDKNLYKIPPFNDFIKNNKLSNKPIIALLAGSRKQEIERMLPIMLYVSSKYKDYQFVIAGVSAIDINLYKEIINEQLTDKNNITLLIDSTYEILKYSKAAIVTSGTATLETALFDVPQIVCFKVNSFVYAIITQFVKIKYFSLVNIVMASEIVKEILQFRLEEQIKTELDKILYDEKYNTSMIESYQALKEKLGGTGASERTAEIIYNDLQLFN